MRLTDGFWCFLLGDGFLGDFLGDERPPGSLFKSMQADKVLGSTGAKIALVLVRRNRGCLRLGEDLSSS